MITIGDFRKELLGANSYDDSEKYFITVTIIVAEIFAIAITTVQIINSPSIWPIIVDSGTIILMLILYYLVRFKNKLYFPKLILTIGGLILGDLTWYAQSLSNGPVLLFIVIFAALILWAWDGMHLISLMTLYFINLGILFYIDYNAPPYLYEYPNREIRVIDTYISLIIYASLLIFLLYIIKRGYTIQKEKAVNSDRLKSDFLANMSHEIRTPMNGILGFTDLLKQADLNTEEQKLYIDVIEKSGTQMLNIVNNIVDISKIEAGLVKIRIQETDVNEHLKYIYKFFKPEVESKGMKLIYNNRHSTQKTIIRTDSEKLLAILTNLVKNAIKYSKKGEIEFGYIIKNKFIEFYVNDTGSGIPKNKQKDVFNRYIKANNDSIQGAGLGLAITKSYIDMLDGKIWFESESGVGSTFCFSLPLLSQSDSGDKIKHI